MKGISFSISIFFMIILWGAQYSKKVFEMVKEKDTKSTHVLKNDLLEIHIDLPLKNYNFSRFDWTGKITKVKYRGISVAGIERTDLDENKIGKGYYNEFGIDLPVAYDETAEGEWFHKIGIGSLKKDGAQYDFSKEYEIEPADFNLTSTSNKLVIECISQSINGFSYVLKKEIELLESSFVIRYYLQNTGEKIITSNEYTHNFLAINEELVGSNYILRFPFKIKPELFGETVNPEGVVEIGQNEIRFNNTPREQFFFSKLSGNEQVNSSWELINTKSKIGISETGSFKTDKVNLWGWKHVISPELFFDLSVKPDQVCEWTRTYHVFDIN